MQSTTDYVNHLFRSLIGLHNQILIRIRNFYDLFETTLFILNSLDFAFSIMKNN